MATTFMNKGTYTSGTGALSVPVPSGYAANDLFLLLVETAMAPVSTPAGGWQAVTGSPLSRGALNTAGGITFNVWWKVATASESSVGLTQTGYNHRNAQIIAFRGVDATTPIEAINSLIDTTNSAAIFPTVTSLSANAMIVNIVGLDRDATSTAVMSAWANTDLVSITEGHDQTVNTGVGGGFAFAYGIKASAGLVKATTATEATTRGYKVYFTMALKPVAAIAAPTVSTKATTTDGTKILLTFNKAMNDPTGKHSVFGVLANSVPQTISSLSLNANTNIIELNLASPLVYGQTITVSHTYNASYKITSTDTGELESFTASAVTNNTVDLTGIHIEKKIGDGSWIDIAIDDVSPYVDASTFVEGTIYYYRAREYKDGAYGAYSNTTSITYTTESTGVNFKVNVDGLWKSVESVKVNVDGLWKAVESVKVNVDGLWKTV